MASVVQQCLPGINDCAIDATGSTCAAYNGIYDDPEGKTWLLVLSFIIMATMAFGIGANDVANAWGTSVGSNAISVRKACIIAGLANWLGAVTLGYGVSSKISKGVAKINDPDCWACGFCDSQVSVYAVGMFGALIGAALFLLLATFTEMPVSTTHAIIGGIVGMTIFAVGGSCLNWKFSGGLGGIIASWIISPALSGLIGIFLYVTTDKLIINSSSPRRNALLFMPIMYGLTTFIMLFLILLKSQPTKKMRRWKMIVIALASAIAVTSVVQLYLVPWIKKRFPSVRNLNLQQAIDNDVDPAMTATPTNTVITEHVKIETPKKAVAGVLVDEEARNSAMSIVGGIEVDEALENSSLTIDQQDAMYVFRYLLLLVATLESFAHGSNDTANSTAPLAAIYAINQDGFESCRNFDTPVWIMAIAGFFVLVGINVLGYKVMRTIGSRITRINLHRGFCMEFASTITIVIATLLKLPVSTTHCQVGAVVFTSLYSVGKTRVSLPLVTKIVASWVITLPFAGLVAAFFTWVFRAAVRA